MTRPSELLKSQTDPAALFWLANDYARAVGDDAALRRADYYSQVSRELKKIGGNGEDMQQAGDAIREAVAVRESVKRDAAKKAAA